MACQPNLGLKRISQQDSVWLLDVAQALPKLPWAALETRTHASAKVAEPSTLEEFEGKLANWAVLSNTDAYTPKSPDHAGSRSLKTVDRKFSSILKHLKTVDRRLT